MDGQLSLLCHAGQGPYPELIPFPLALESVDNLPKRVSKAAIEWAVLLRENLHIALSESGLLDAKCSTAPNKRGARDQKPLIEEIALLLYPTSTEDPKPAVDKYFLDVIYLRRVRESQAYAIAEQAKKSKPAVDKWTNRILNQGPWDEKPNPALLAGTKALPMPVTVSDAESLEQVFSHLEGASRYDDSKIASPMQEPHYGTPAAEFEKGIIYEDGRMDLCKMVLGPPNIVRLLDSLEKNTFVRHFLLGNNIIGFTGAARIAKFIGDFPGKIETWYLAGNCIGPASFETLVQEWTKSPAVTNIWLKRNPLGPTSRLALSRLIIKTPSLRTLDLDQTELGDDTLKDVFNIVELHALQNPLPLRHLYLNAAGVGFEACRALGAFLALPNCQLESIYLSNNPIGDSGAAALADGLRLNKSLHRVMLSSCGLNSTSAITVLEALKTHTRLFALDLGTSYATQDLGSKYNYLTNDIEDALIDLAQNCKTLKYLNFFSTFFNLHIIDRIIQSLALSSSLLVFKATTTFGKKQHPLFQKALQKTLLDNVQKCYGKEMTYENFLKGEVRWLWSPKDVRFIDSAYRNRDMGLARRGLKVLEKNRDGWEGEVQKMLEGEEVLEEEEEHRGRNEDLVELVW